MTSPVRLPRRCPGPSNTHTRGITQTGLPKAHRRVYGRRTRSLPTRPLLRRRLRQRGPCPGTPTGKTLSQTYRASGRRHEDRALMGFPRSVSHASGPASLAGRFWRNESPSPGWRDRLRHRARRKVSQVRRRTWRATCDDNSPATTRLPSIRRFGVLFATAHAADAVGSADVRQESRAWRRGREAEKPMD